MVPFFGLLVLSLIVLVFLLAAAAHRPGFAPVESWVRKLGFWKLYPLLLVGLVIGLGMMTGDPTVGFVIGLVVGLVGFVVTWLRQFTFLMQLGDGDFPGRYDKLIWAALLVALPPVGVLTFWSYREAHWPSHRKLVTWPARHDLA
jgi:hypothetical protein